MSALSIQPTYPIFTETDGLPLENGYIWIGTVNLDPQVNPISVYWDAALTQPAGQPIRTLNGYPSNNGTPGRLYVNSDYSIRVMNKNGSVVYSAPAAIERYSGSVITGINASSVIYEPPFTNAVPTTAEAEFALVVNAQNFGAVGDGVNDDTVAIQNALDYAAGNTVSDRTTGQKTVRIPATTNFYRTTSPLVVGPGVTLTGDNWGSAIIADSGNVLDLNGNRDQTIREIRLETTGSGSIGIKMDNVYRANIEHVRITGADYGVKGSKNLYNVFRNCSIGANVKGIELVGSAGTWNNPAGWFNNVITLDQVRCFGDEVSTTGIDITGMAVYMSNCDTSSNLIGVRIAGTDSTAINRSKTSTIINHYNEKTDTCFQFKDVTHCTVIDNYAQGRASGFAATCVYDLDNAKVYVTGNALIDYFEHVVVAINASEINWPTSFQYFVDTAFSSLTGGSIAQALLAGASVNNTLTYTDIPLGASSPTSSSHATSQDNGATSVIFEGRQTDGVVRHRIRVGGASNWNSADAAHYVARDTTTSRSINAAGTVNASGTDYAEYMTKREDCGVIDKGAICGIDENGLLTDSFSLAKTFVVKSTNPSYVGGDGWGVDLEGTALEEARAKVDRIAFSGQVPVNVVGATQGQYIIPIDDNGKIAGAAVSNPTLEQYVKAVGKVIAIEQDGRSKIIVKTV